MSDRVSTTREGQAAVIVLDSPPRNCLDQALCVEIDAALSRAEADNTIKSIIIRGEGGCFSAQWHANGDLESPAKNALADLCARVEAFPKPVIACLEGAVVGSGLDLALAAHWRVAGETALLCFPEISFGLMPSGGGVLRTPRLLGAKVALDMLLLGRQYEASQALAVGLVDQVVAEPEGAAISMANGALKKRIWSPANGTDYLSEIKTQKERVGSSLPARARILDCVEAELLLPGEEAQEFARIAYLDCLASPEAQALVHVDKAERGLWSIPDLDLSRIRPVRRIGIVGGGTMSADIAMTCLTAGFPVVLAEKDENARDKATKKIEARIFGDLNEGAIREEDALACISRLSPAIWFEDLAGCSLVIEAAGLDSVKTRRIFAALEKAAPGAILATASSHWNIDGIAQATSRSDRVLGLHFYAPIESRRCVEVGLGQDTADWAVASVFAFVRQLKKLPVYSRPKGGWIGQRIEAVFQHALSHLISRGANPDEIKKSFAEVGFNFHLRDWPEASGQTALLIKLEDIRRRAFAAMANEGGRLVNEKVALRPSDIDAVAINGLGFPRRLGGPLHWADQKGLLLLHADMERWSKEDSTAFTPHPIWNKLIKNGERFGDISA